MHHPCASPCGEVESGFVSSIKRGNPLTHDISIRYFENMIKNSQDAVLRGYVEAGYGFFLHVIRQDNKRAMNVLKQAADAGNPWAQNTYGVCLVDGDGVEADQKAGFNYLAMSAASGHCMALYNMAMCYHSGDGVEKDKSKAMSLFKQAALLGNKSAMTEYAVCLDSAARKKKPTDDNAKDIYLKAVRMGDKVSLYCFLI